MMIIHYHWWFCADISLGLVESCNEVLWLSYLIWLKIVDKRHSISIAQYRRPLKIDVCSIMVL